VVVLLLTETSLCFSAVFGGCARRSSIVPDTGYLKAVWPEFCGSVFGVWAAPGGFKTIQKCRGFRPPHFWMVLKPPGAAQTPKTDPTNSGQIAFRYPETWLLRSGLGSWLLLGLFSCSLFFESRHKGLAEEYLASLVRANLTRVYHRYLRWCSRTGQKTHCVPFTVVNLHLKCKFVFLTSKAADARHFASFAHDTLAELRDRFAAVPDFDLVYSCAWGWTTLVQFVFGIRAPRAAEHISAV
jgi:hypothetical protein